MSDQRSLMFVGPLPPPMHGFSFVNGQMLARFEALGEVSVFDRAPAAAHGMLARVARTLATLGRLLKVLCARPAPVAMYLGLSGGRGQLVDMAYIVAARLAGLRVVVHHHSFAYLRKRRWYTTLVMTQLRGARHIVLCACMAEVLQRVYRITSTQVDVVSNAAFLSLPLANGNFTQRGQQTLRLGFLSNITADKGIFLFFEVGAALYAQGIAVEGVVAGPLAPEIAERFWQSLADQPWCKHIGAVYGADKDAFLNYIDLLVFPTLYVNEAEPVTILEALRAGVPVVANQRGCISELVPTDAGAVFDEDAEFVHLAAAQIGRWNVETGAQWAARQASAQRAFKRLHTAHATRIDTIVRKLIGSATSSATT